jgi:uncharacterized protein (TIGR00730 family)
MKSVTVYCGSANGSDTAHTELARRLGVEVARRDLRLVYGGGNVGLMGQTASAAHRAGGKVLGIMPTFLRHIEGTLEDVEHIFVETMHERKKMLFDEADGFVVLPGGIGTLEEAIETLSWAKLSLHRKPMAFLSTNGYWDPLFSLFDHIIDGGFAPRSLLELVVQAQTPSEAIDALAARHLVLD